MSKTSFRKVAVLGAGNMGSRIAAHLANAGVPVVLLDIASTNLNAALDLLTKSKPPAFFEPESVRLIQTGSFEEDMGLLSDCDWIIEAVTEDLEIKRALLNEISTVRRNNSIVTTNTSGLPVAQIAAGMPDDFRRNWFGTHFFNPPRYMRLLELIATDETEPAAIDAVAEFAGKRLGKTTVHAKDTPNFIGNRIGTFALLNTMRIMQEMDLTIEEVDALTGAPLGWPKTGTFRLNDLIGIDVLGHIAKNFSARMSDERADVSFPAFMTEMAARNWIGDKAGQGFYKNQKGKEQRLGLDWKTLEYRPSASAKFPLLDAAKKTEPLASRLRFLLGTDVREDRAGAFYWRTLPDIWNYSANRVPEISDDIAGIDQAMKAGFNWEMGPFEMWDAVGVVPTVERMRNAGIKLAPALEKLLASGATAWYKTDPAAPCGRLVFDVLSGEYKSVEVFEGVCSAAVLRKANGVVRENSGASLIDLGEGIACLEFQTKMNVIDNNISAFVSETLDPEGQGVSQFEGFIIASDAANFSAGADLTGFLQAIQEKRWDELERLITAFQRMTQSIKFCPRAVIVAPFGLCLGGGAELALHAAARQAHAELSMGLVESAVGLVPGGGGCKEMTLRAIDSGQTEADLRRSFENITAAKISTSAAEARRLGFLSNDDGVTMNRARLFTDAKTRAQEMIGSYSAPVPRSHVPAPGQDILSSLTTQVQLMRESGSISDHDVTVRNHIAHILCGGRLAPGTLVSEQYFLELEREAFLSLCGEKKTEERIAFTLKIGKPLKN